MTTDADPQETGDALKRLLERQIELYRAVRARMQDQRALVDAGEIDTLMRQMGEIDRDIKRAQALAAEAETWQERWDRHKDGLEPAVRAGVEAAAETLRQLLGEIVLLGDEGQRALEQAKGETGVQISKLQKGKALHKAYKGLKPPLPGARFRDQQT